MTDASTWPDLLRAQPIGSCLDAACGDGTFAEELLVEGQGMTLLVGFDPDPNAVEEAREHFANHGPPELAFRFFCADIAGFYAGIATGDFARIPSPAPLSGNLQGQWDTVAMQDALHHLRDASADLERLWDLVAPGGRLIVSEVFCDGLTAPQHTELELHELKAAVDRIVGIDHFAVLERAAVQKLVAAAVGNDSGLVGIVCQPGDGTESTAAVEARLDWMDAYLGHAAGHPEYAGLRKRFSQFSVRARQTGIAGPPRIVLICTKPARHGELRA